MKGPGTLQVPPFPAPLLLGLLASLGAHLGQPHVELPSQVERRFKLALKPLLGAPDFHYVAVEAAAEAVDMILIDMHRGIGVLVGRGNALQVMMTVGLGEHVPDRHLFAKSVEN